MVIGFGLGVAYSTVLWGSLAAMWLVASEWPEYAAWIYVGGTTVALLSTLGACIVPITLGVQRLNALDWEH